MEDQLMMIKAIYDVMQLGAIIFLEILGHKKAEGSQNVFMKNMGGSQK